MVDTGNSTGEGGCYNAKLKSPNLCHTSTIILKVTVPQTNFDCPNFILWIVMGCGSSFWSETEGPKNHLNLKILVSKLVPWDLEGCRTSDLEGRRYWTSRGGVRTLRGGAMIGVGGAATLEVPGGQTLRLKFSSSVGFKAPSTKTSYTTPHYYQKYEV